MTSTLAVTLFTTPSVYLIRTTLLRGDLPFVSHLEATTFVWLRLR